MKVKKNLQLTAKGLKTSLKHWNWQTSLSLHLNQTCWLQYLLPNTTWFIHFIKEMCINMAVDHVHLRYGSQGAVKTRINCLEGATQSKRTIAKISTIVF